MIDADRWRLLRYALPLRQPLTSGSGTRRVGLLLEVHRDGAIGYGEAAPIPGFHEESLSEVQRQIHRAMRGEDWPSSAVARFCIEGAALSLTAAQRTCRPADLLVPSPAPFTPVNGLINSDDPVTSARGFFAAGCTAVKIKVGRRDPAQEVSAIRAVATSAPGLQIRLDANRAWGLDDACRFAEALSGVGLDYIEEPLQDPSLLDRFHDRTGVPVALDESLSETTASFPTGTAALVIKPTVIGGLAAALALAGRATQAGLRAVISATFESSIGLGILTELACATSPTPPPQGLGTGRWLMGDVVHAPLRPQNFRLQWAAPVLNGVAIPIEP